MDDLAKPSLEINGEKWDGWDKLSIERSIDGFDQCSFETIFDKTNEKFKATFRPFSYHSASILIDDELLFKGFMMDISPETSPEKKSLKIECYAMSAVLNDCTAPIDIYPLEFSGVKLDIIARKLCEPFGIAVVFQADPGAVFDKIKLDQSASIAGFLFDLAKQRGLLVKSNPSGDLIFFKTETDSKPISLDLDGNENPVTNIQAKFDPQKYYSEITCISRSTDDDPGTTFTAQNPNLSSPRRPYVKLLKDTGSADIEAAAKAALGRMIAGAVTYTITLSTLFSQYGDLLEPGQILSIIAPDAMIYTRQLLLIKKVIFNISTEEQTSQLECVLTGAYSGEIGDDLPWD